MDENLQFAFRKIYQENLWGSEESRSGPGSTIAYTKSIRESLPTLLKFLSTKTFLDAPCGDFNWMREIDLGDINYIGADIVPEIIERNQSAFESEKHKFLVLDVTTDPLPEADTWMCRDLLIHLPLASIAQLLNQFINSKTRYLLTTHFPGSGDNSEISSMVMGRLINLTKRPFLLPEPIHAIKDFEEPGTTRTLAVWERESLKKSLEQQQDILEILLKKR